MALAIADGVLYDDTNPWVDYYVLNSEEAQVYYICKDGDDILFEESVEAELNPQIEDSVDGTMYYLAITDTVLWLDSGEVDCTMTDLCTKLEELKTTLLDMTINDAKQTDTIIELSNGWKAIT